MNHSIPEKNSRDISLFNSLNNKKLNNFQKSIILLFLSIIITSIVYQTGGTKSAWPQLYYIVIILAAHFWKIKGGLIIAFALGIMAGPWMPLDISQGIMQKPENWIIRLFSFMIVGFIVSYILQQNQKSSNLIKEKNLTNEYNGLNNKNKLDLEMEQLISKGVNFSLIFFDIKNLGEIQKYVNSDIVKDITDHCISSIQALFGNVELYSSNYNEYLLILKEFNQHEIHQTIAEYLQTILKSMKIRGYFFNLIIKVGIVFHNDDSMDVKELNRKVRVAASQGEPLESGVYIFDSRFDEEMKILHEVSGSLQNDINNNKFYVVYQPIINILTNEISSVEVLARWDRGNKKPIGPDIFIKIAEETGLIQSLSKEVIRQGTNQFLAWDEVGIKIKASYNITADEFMDEAFVAWVREFIDTKNINKEYFGFEITERVLSKDSIKLNTVLSYLHKNGYSISIDDFGTGHNTLKDLIDMAVNIVKIDKFFIDRIHEKDAKSLIKHLIKLSHEMGLEVIAEGVETKEQFMVLKQLGCDMIQGYYFSKPLLANDFVEYYQTFDMTQYE